MTNQVIRNITLCLALALVASCGVEPQLENKLHIHTNANEAGELWVSVNYGEPLWLLHDAQGYRPLVSPNGEWLAVEVRLLSDLEIVRLFRRDGNRFIASDKDVTAIAWRQMATANDIELEVLSHTKARVSGWSNEGMTLRLELSALGPDEPGQIETDIAIPLD